MCLLKISELFWRMHFWNRYLEFVHKLFDSSRYLAFSVTFLSSLIKILLLLILVLVKILLLLILLGRKWIKSEKKINEIKVIWSFYFAFWILHQKRNEASPNFFICISLYIFFPLVSESKFSTKSSWSQAIHFKILSIFCFFELFNKKPWYNFAPRSRS